MVQASTNNKMYSKHAASFKDPKDSTLNLNHILQETDQLTADDPASSQIRSLRLLQQKQDFNNPQSALDEVLPSKLKHNTPASYSRRLADTSMMAYAEHAQSITQRRYHYNVQQNHSFAPKTFISNLGRKWASLPKLSYRPSQDIDSTYYNSQVTKQTNFPSHVEFRPQSDMIINKPLSRPNTPVRPQSDSNSNYIDIPNPSAHVSEYHKYLEKRRNGVKPNVLNLTEDEEDSMLFHVRDCDDSGFENELQNITQIPVENDIENMIQPNRDIEIVPFPAVAQEENPSVPFQPLSHRKENISFSPTLSLKMPIRINVKITKPKQVSSQNPNISVVKKDLRKPLKPPRLAKQMSDSMAFDLGKKPNESDNGLNEDIVPSSLGNDTQVTLPKIINGHHTTKKEIDEDLGTPVEILNKGSANRKNSVDSGLSHPSPILRKEKNLLCDGIKLSKHEGVETESEIKSKKSGTDFHKLKDNTKQHENVIASPTLEKSSELSEMAITGSKVGSKPQVSKGKQKRTSIASTKTKQEAENKSTNIGKKSPLPSTSTKSQNVATKVKSVKKAPSQDITNSEEQDQYPQLSASTSSSIKGVLKRKGDKKSKKKKSVQFGPKFVREVTKITYPWNEVPSESDSDSSYEDSDDEDDEDFDEDDEEGNDSEAEDIVDREVENVLRSVEFNAETSVHGGRDKLKNSIEDKILPESATNSDNRGTKREL